MIGMAIEVFLLSLTSVRGSVQFAVVLLIKPPIGGKKRNVSGKKKLRLADKGIFLIGTPRERWHSVWTLPNIFMANKYTSRFLEVQ